MLPSTHIFHVAHRSPNPRFWQKKQRTFVPSSPPVASLLGVVLPQQLRGDVDLLHLLARPLFCKLRLGRSLQERVQIVAELVHRFFVDPLQALLHRIVGVPRLRRPPLQLACALQERPLQRVVVRRPQVHRHHPRTAAPRRRRGAPALARADAPRRRVRTGRQGVAVVAGALRGRRRGTVVAVALVRRRRGGVLRPPGRVVVHGRGKGRWLLAVVVLRAVGRRWVDGTDEAGVHLAPHDLHEGSGRGVVVVEQLLLVLAARVAAGPLKVEELAGVRVLRADGGEGRAVLLVAQDAVPVRVEALHDAVDELVHLSLLLGCVRRLVVVRAAVAGALVRRAASVALCRCLEVVDVAHGMQRLHAAHVDVGQPALLPVRHHLAHRVLVLDGDAVHLDQLRVSADACTPRCADGAGDVRAVLLVDGDGVRHAEVLADVDAVSGDDVAVLGWLVLRVVDVVQRRGVTRRDRHGASCVRVLHGRGNRAPPPLPCGSLLTNEVQIL
eukprot:Rhum_TRINITY_DN4005_c0_g1::Rhum_TRINITY_DN4005_c0_g1_i1::g.12708::m.12708